MFYSLLCIVINIFTVTVIFCSSDIS